MVWTVKGRSKALVDLRGDLTRTWEILGGNSREFGDMVRDSFAGLRSPQGRGENLNSLVLWGGGRNWGFLGGKVFSFLKT